MTEEVTHVLKSGEHRDERDAAQVPRRQIARGCSRRRRGNGRGGSAAGVQAQPNTPAWDCSMVGGKFHGRTQEEHQHRFLTKQLWSFHGKENMDMPNI